MDLSGIKAAFFAMSWFCSSATILDVRLRDGDSPNSGRVEVNVEGIGWNTVCGSSHWGLSDVRVTCRQLGFAGAQLEATRSEFGSGTAPLYKKVINCKGNEDSLDECRMSSWQCTGQSAGAVCHGPSYLGCYGDNPLSRLFTGTSYVDSDGMTINDCITFCRQRDFEYAGIELGSECYCGHAGTNYTRYGLFGDGDCRYTCTGNSLETCGGVAKMAVHRTVIPTTVTMATTTRLSSARTPNPLERTTNSPRNTTMMTSSSSMTSKVITPTGDSQQVQATLSDQTMIIVYILGALLFFCILVIIGCFIWNRRLRSRISYNVTKEPDTPPNQGINALPYMTLSERRPDHPGGTGYQSLSVQRKEKQIDEMPEGPYAEGLGEPVYQEPEVYLVPDNVCSVSYKPGDPVTDDLFLGGSNEYETLQAM